MTDKNRIDSFFTELRQSVLGDVLTDDVARILYSTDASIYQVRPHGVFIPRSVDDVQKAVALAARHRVPILPRGGGTSLAGQAVNEALVIDLTRHLDQIIEVNREEKWVRAQTGISLGTLNAHLKPLGLKFGPDPASGSRAALGGIVGNNSSGSHSILYGMTADHLLAAEVILSDGSRVEFAPRSEDELVALQAGAGLEAEIYRRMLALVRDPANLEVIRSRTPRHWRRCGGYNLDRLTDGQGLSFRWPYDPRFNLAKIICGSEGTLGVVTEVTLNLVDVPKMTGLSVVHFAGLRPALDAVPVMLELNPTAIELVDRHWLKLVEHAPQYAKLTESFVQGNPDCILITEFYGETSDEIVAQQRRLATHLAERGVPVQAITDVNEPDAIDIVWKVRNTGFGILMGMRGDVKPLTIIDDAAVPPEHLSDYIPQLEAYCRETLGHDIAYFAHASAGCLHVHSLLNAKLGSDVAKLPQIVAYAGGLLRQYGGVLSSEHGDGRLRSWLNPEFFGPELYGLFEQVKAIFDPHNLFNPGDIVGAPAMTEHLRFGPAYHALPLTPLLDFRDEQGFDRAVELCNGTAACRQLTGTMCPTFRATRDEGLSTRGRANVLRAAISGAIAFDSPEVRGTLDLCVSCKACKTECPSAVDMARLKAEYQGQYYRTHALPLRSRFFAHFDDLSRLAGGPLAPIANAVLQNRFARGVVDNVLHLAPQRALPRFARQTFDAWVRQRRSNSRDGARRQLILLVDTVHTYNEPEVARAALRVLEAAGFDVVVAPFHDVGRPAMSKGALSIAKRKVSKALDWLAPHASAGKPIVGLEPSDVSMLVDDALMLWPDDARARSVAKTATTLEECLWRELKVGRLEGVFRPQVGNILLHGHCHQKALFGTRHSEELLSSLGYSVLEAGSACCGMAGSFGYEAEHLDLSLRMGELTLFPAVRKQSEDALIVAAGVSCHEQIAQGTGRRALHPAEVLERALA